MEEGPGTIRAAREREALEFAACRPHLIHPAGFNPHAVIPYGCTTEHIRLVMQEFLDFLHFVNIQLHSRRMRRLESFIMPANFSSIVGEFMSSNIPKYCRRLVKNRYHNGHPDMIPAGVFPGDSAQYSSEGIEVKASRYLKGWQGHNPEHIWLIVFVYDSNRPKDVPKESADPDKEAEEIEAPGVPPLPFRFIKVVAAQLSKKDWKFSGRSETSRRTITASVLNSGFIKMEDNWIYRDPDSPKSAMYAKPVKEQLTTQRKRK